MHKAKERRIVGAAERTAKRSNRSIPQQIEILNARLGPCVGAEKERDRLGDQIEAIALAAMASIEKKEKKAEKARNKDR